MGLRDRDYMRESSEDDRRVESYEEAAHAQEYGDPGLRRRRVSTLALLVVAVLVLLILLGAWLGS